MISESWDHMCRACQRLHRQGQAWKGRLKWSCRDCTKQVQMFSEICPYCGIANPVRLPLWSLLLFLVACVLAYSSS